MPMTLPPTESSARTTPAAYDTDEARWAAFSAADRRADGRFVTAVATTGIYCRPSCPAKRAKRENVRFYATPAAAEAAGFRACKRCRPDADPPEHAHAAAIAQACRLIAAAERPPSLAVLAAGAGLSPFHFHRTFRRITGVTPRAYGRAERAGRLDACLREARTVTEAAFDAGYAASSRFYAEAGERLGMSPTRYRDGGSGAAIRYAVAACSLGALLVAATRKGVCAIMIGDDPGPLIGTLKARFPKAHLTPNDPDFDRLIATVVGLAEAPGVPVDLPLDITGTAFQQRVWEALKRIPAGSTATYKEIAVQIGDPGAVRAVAQACGANPVALAIPCHRVVRSDGGLSGYHWGVERKRALLAKEGARRDLI